MFAMLRLWTNSVYMCVMVSWWCVYVAGFVCHAETVDQPCLYVCDGVMVVCLCGRIYDCHAETVDQPCLHVCDAVMVVCLCGRIYVCHAEAVDQPCLHVCDGVELCTTIRCGRRTLLLSQVHREPVLLPHLESQHGHG